MITLDELVSEAHILLTYMIGYRRYFHVHPELGGDEYGTQAYILKVLRDIGIDAVKIADTGVIATIHGLPDGKVVAFRGDMDALPITEVSKAPYRSAKAGVMHACGHDAHTAILLGLGIYFNENRTRFHGTVRLLFQPAEETVGGAKRMVNEGCLKSPDVDFVLGIHMMPYLYYDEVELKYGTLNASTDTMTITVNGAGGHGAYPDLGVDAINIAAAIVVNAQSIISRNVSPLRSGVISFGTFNGGIKSNIIADKVVMEASIRASDPATRNTIINRLTDMATSMAISMGGSADIDISEDNYPPLVNNAAVLGVVEEAAMEYAGANNIHIKEMASMGGEDFSFFIKDVPGAFYHIGCHVPSMGDYNLHMNCFDIDERALETGMVMQAWTALKLMGDAN